VVVAAVGKYAMAVMVDAMVGSVVAVAGIAIE
jgi:hypothetical protein